MPFDVIGHWQGLTGFNPVFLANADLGYGTTPLSSQDNV
jgi:hypothetical protein